MEIASYFVDLDLGQSADFTAMTIIERVGSRESEYEFNCRHLKQWELRTSYPSRVAHVVGIMASTELRPQGAVLPVLAVDATGVGAPVVDLFRQERMNVSLKAAQITGGVNGVQ